MRDIFSLLHATIRKHGQQRQTVRLGNAWVNVDPRGWKTRDDMTINVALGSGGKEQQFAQTMQSPMCRATRHGRQDQQGRRPRAPLRIMGHKNADPSSRIRPRSIRRPGNC